MIIYVDVLDFNTIQHLDKPFGKYMQQPIYKSLERRLLTYPGPFVAAD